jgi:hypothetical protein
MQSDTNSRRWELLRHTELAVVVMVVHGAPAPHALTRVCKLAMENIACRWDGEKECGCSERVGVGVGSSYHVE